MSTDLGGRRSDVLTGDLVEIIDILADGEGVLAADQLFALQQLGPHGDELIRTCGLRHVVFLSQWGLAFCIIGAPGMYGSHH